MNISVFFFEIPWYFLLHSHRCQVMIQKTSKLLIAYSSTAFFDSPLLMFLFVSLYNALVIVSL